MKKMDKIVVREWFLALIYALIILGVLSLVFWPMRVKGRSMENTLYNNDFIIVSKAITLIKDYNYNDLIVLYYNDNGHKEKIVKRIIGLEGDHIRIHDNKVIRNGEVLIEEYVKGKTTGNVDIFVPKENVFFLGDNRSISKDSRILGCFNRSQIRGKVILSKKSFLILLTFMMKFDII